MQVALIPILFLSSFTPTIAQDAYELSRKMFEATNNIQTLKYQMNKRERIDGKMVEQKSLTKLHRIPLKVYVKQLYPKEGVEVLYVDGKYDNHALVNPNGFPWFNIKLDPIGNTMRENQHHTLFQSGFDHVVNILEHLFRKYEEQIKSMIFIEDTVVYNNRRSYILKLTNPNFQYVSYKLGKGENIDDVAKKFMISQHMILEKNPHINNVNDVEEGQIITIPNDYSSGMVLYIDAEEYIPLVMKVYDDKGIYEHYEYKSVEINPKIKEEEFTESFHEYGF